MCRCRTPKHVFDQKYRCYNRPKFLTKSDATQILSEQAQTWQLRDIKSIRSSILQLTRHTDRTVLVYSSSMKEF